MVKFNKVFKIYKHCMVGLFIPRGINPGKGLKQKLSFKARTDFVLMIIQKKSDYYKKNLT